MGRASNSVLQSHDTIAEKTVGEDVGIGGELLLRAIDTVPVLISFVGTDLRYRFVNKAYQQWYGKPREAIIGTHIKTVLGATLYKQIRTYIDDALLGNNVAYEHERMHSDGSRHHVMVNYIPYIRTPKKNGGFFVLVNDISKIKKTESELKDSKVKLETEAKKLHTIFDTLPVGIFIAKVPTGESLMMNKVGEELLGRGFIPGVRTEEYSKTYNIVKEDGTAYPTDELPITITLKTGKLVRKDDLFIMKPDGRRIALRVTAAPVVTPTGNNPYAIGIFEDVTNEYEMERVRGEFISITSHSLRTPLTSILWHIEMILGGHIGSLTTDQKNYINKIYKSNKRLMNLVNMLLNASRIDLGTLSIEPKPLHLGRIAKSVLSELAADIERKELTIVYEREKGLPRVIADPYFIQAVLENLFSNAVKYTPPQGTICIRLSTKNKDVLITVSDTGYGIPKKQVSKIFTKLFRADNVRGREPEGAGLGLYIDKAIVELSGGTIWFETEENKGTTFYVTLPTLITKLR